MRARLRVLIGLVVATLAVVLIEGPTIPAIAGTAPTVVADQAGALAPYERPAPRKGSVAWASAKAKATGQRQVVDASADGDGDRLGEPRRHHDIAGSPCSRPACATPPQGAGWSRTRRWYNVPTARSGPGSGRRHRVLRGRRGATARAGSPRRWGARRDRLAGRAARARVHRDHCDLPRRPPGGRPRVQGLHGGVRRALRREDVREAASQPGLAALGTPVAGCARTGITLTSGHDGSLEARNAEGSLPVRLASGDDVGLFQGLDDVAERGRRASRAPDDLVLRPDHAMLAHAGHRLTGSDRPGHRASPGSVRAWPWSRRGARTRPIGRVARTASPRSAIAPGGTWTGFPADLHRSFFQIDNPILTGRQADHGRGVQRVQD